MKKIIFILSFFVSILSCNAVPIGEWTDELTENPNLEIIDEEARYRWYKEIVSYSDYYYIEGENDINFPLIDRKDYRDSDWSNWSDVLPIEKSNRVTEIENSSMVRTIKPVRYVTLKGFYNSKDIFYISRIRVFIDGNQVFPSMTCSNCSTDLVSKLQNGNESSETYVINSSSLKIDLGDFYGIERIVIELALHSNTSANESFDIYYNGDERIDYSKYGYNKLVYNLNSNDYLNPYILSIVPNESFVYLKVYTDWFLLPGIVEPTFYRDVKLQTNYRYKDRLYRYYKIDKKYIDGFYNMLDDPLFIKDESVLKTFYIYSEKEKCILDAEEDENPPHNPFVCPSISNVFNDFSQKNTQQFDSQNRFYSNEAFNNVNASIASSVRKLSPNSFNNLESFSISNKKRDNLLILIFISLILSFLVFYGVRRYNLSHQK